MTRKQKTARLKKLHNAEDVLSKALNKAYRLYTAAFKRAERLKRQYIRADKRYAAAVRETELNERFQ